MLIQFEQQKQDISYQPQQRGSDIVRRYFSNSQDAILCMACDGELQSLSNIIPKSVECVIFYNIHHPMGALCLAISTTALMLMAAEGLFPNSKISVEHSLGKGFYCEPTQPKTLPERYLDDLEAKMHAYIEAEYEFEERIVSMKQIDDFDYKRFNVLKYSPRKQLRIYDLLGFPHWFISPLTPSAKYIRQFQITACENGFVLRFPTRTSPDSIPPFTPSPNLFKVIRESEERGSMLGIRHVYDLNQSALNGKHLEMIQLYEALHEKKISQIADKITQKPDVRFVFIAGASSSGKTTFMKRLSLQLRINGLKLKHISLDDYFLDREHTPKDERGELDFEHFDAIDHKLLDTQLAALIDGKGVHLPRFNFNIGKKEFAKEKTFLHNDEILILEGIHGLNPNLARHIYPDKKFKIYISALTQLNFNLYNRVSTSDTRLLRRMYRDLQFRGHSLEDTLKRWPSVRNGETRWIFPFQEYADVYFNSALEYEWSVFSGILLEKLSSIPNDSPVKVEAERLCRLMELFVPFPIDMIPPTSIIQEFLGGSSFDY